MSENAIQIASTDRYIYPSIDDSDNGDDDDADATSIVMRGLYLIIGMNIER